MAPLAILRSDAPLDETTMNMQLGSATMKAPVGEIRIAGRDNVLYALDYGDCEARLLALLHRRFGRVTLDAPDPLIPIRQAVEGYFHGELTAFDTVCVHTGGTFFQQRVWSALREIPAGTTCTYGELAKRVGNPQGARAVGLANARNPIALVIPCHRIIGANGKLTGYAGGIERKRWLLEHEGFAHV